MGCQIVPKLAYQKEFFRRCQPFHLRNILKDH